MWNYDVKSLYYRTVHQIVIQLISTEFREDIFSIHASNVTHTIPLPFAKSFCTCWAAQHHAACFNANICCQVRAKDATVLLFLHNLSYVIFERPFGWFSGLFISTRQAQCYRFAAPTQIFQVIEGYSTFQYRQYIFYRLERLLRN